MTIGQLSAASAIPASTIRYWESICILPKAPRLSGQRRFTPDSIHHLAVLSLAKRCGFNLKEMRHLAHGFANKRSPSATWRSIATKRKQQLEHQIRDLRAMLKLLQTVETCNCLDIIECGKIAASLH